MAEDIQFENLNVTVAELRQEAVRLSNLVTSANLRIIVADKETEKSKKAKIVEEEKLSEILKKKEKISLECSVLAKEKIQHREDNREDIGLLQKEKSKLQKELNRFNSWILTAKSESEKLGLKNKEFDIKLSEKRKKVEIVLGLENEIKEFEKKRDLLRLDNDALMEGGKNQIVILKTEIGKITEEIERLKKEAEYAEIKKKRIDNECTLKTQDLIEYTDRIKNAWDKVFPGRSMPMLK